MLSWASGMARTQRWQWSADVLFKWATWFIHGNWFRLIWLLLTSLVSVLSVWSLIVLPVFVWVSSGCFDFPHCKKHYCKTSQLGCQCPRSTPWLKSRVGHQMLCSSSPLLRSDGLKAENHFHCIVHNVIVCDKDFSSSWFNVLEQAGSQWSKQFASINILIKLCCFSGESLITRRRRRDVGV